MAGRDLFAVEDESTGRDLFAVAEPVIEQPQIEAQPLTISQRIEAAAKGLSFDNVREKFIGNIDSMVEPALTLGTGMVADTVGNIGGGIQSAIQGGDTAGPQARDRIRETLTYQPKNPRSQEVMQNYAETLRPVGEMIDKARLGDEALEAGMPEWVARTAEGIPEYLGAAVAPLGVKTAASTGKTAGRLTGKLSDKKHDIGVLLRNNPERAETAAYKLSGGKVVPHPEAKQALSQGWTKQTVAWVKSSNNATKTNIKKMIDIARGRSPDTGTGRKSMDTRPSDVLGDSLHDRYKFIKGAKDSAGRTLDKIAQTMKGEKVDITDSLKNFDKSLNNLGIKLTRNDAGDLVGDFTYSKIAKSDHGLIKENIRHIDRVMKGNIDFHTAHELKQSLRDTGLSYKETIGKTGASPKVQKLFKNLSREIDQVLDARSKAYDQQNIKYSETIEVVDAVKDVVKKRLFQDSASESMGTLMRKLTSNLDTRNTMRDMLAGIDKVSKKYGGNFSDDLYAQQRIANEMEDVLRAAAAKTSIKGELGASAGRSTANNVLQGVDTGLRHLKGQNETKALNSLQKLLY